MKVIMKFVEGQQGAERGNRTKRVAVKIQSDSGGHGRADTANSQTGEYFTRQTINGKQKHMSNARLE